MAKFDDYLKSSSLTWSDLNESTTKKIDSFETTYTSYSNAFDANDNALADKYEAQLDSLDAEILKAIKKQENDASSKSQAKTDSPLKDVQGTMVEPKPAKQEVNAEGGVVEEEKKESDGGTYIGMFKI
jgi:hypothetical protein